MSSLLVYRKTEENSIVLFEKSEKKCLTQEESEGYRWIFWRQSIHLKEVLLHLN